MPHIIETTAYKFEELEASAKEKARDWYRQHVFSDSNDWEFVYEDAATVADLFGLDIRQRAVKLMGGGTRYESCIYFSGFSSQGDGACFEGSYRYKKGALKAVKSYAPQDKDLHEIVEGLQKVQREQFYKLTAGCVHRGHYSHSGCMDVDVEHADDMYRDIGEAEDVVRQLLREFADWIYARLEAEYDYQSSDEAVDEAITINEYDFSESGKRI